MNRPPSSTGRLPLAVLLPIVAWGVAAPPPAGPPGAAGLDALGHGWPQAGWLQAGWLQAGGLVLAGLALWALHRWRARVLTRRSEARLRLRLEIQSAERERLARELHDTLVQGTTGLVLNVQVALNGLPADSPTRRSLQALLDEADRTMDVARHRFDGLESAAGQPLDLVHRLRRMGEAMARTRTATFKLVPSGSPWRLTRDVQEQLVLIVREALGNAFDHAHASRIVVRLAEAPGRRVLTVQDDGVGFVPSVAAADAIARGQWGVFGMNERAARIGATLEIASAPGRGTRIAIVLTDAARAGWRRW